ncbi:MAG TPA: TIR domain-containing protein [Caulobacteraceae bacterium]|jgi:adenylate cyclase|nr:TIR domain-containing protein [Caulobacteraceae bacterium]
MADVFISYARSTAGQAQAIAEAVRALGYEVWRDDEIPAHRDYASVIEERLTDAKAVVVIWSGEAVKSEWVQSEADRARLQRKLIQLRVDGASLPMPFDRIQCADMTGWTGDLEAPGWRRVAGSIAELVGAAGPASVEVGQASAQVLSMPSIAVLPFANLSNDPEQDYFVDGMVEEIVGALSRYKSIFVAAAGSSLVHKGEEIGPKEAARQLGVRYLLDGSVRKAGGRVRIAVHLTDAMDGAQIWSERLDDTLEDVFALQDRVALRVAGAVETTLQERDLHQIAARPTSNAGSYDLYLRSIRPFRTFRKAEMLAAIELLDQAIALDPNFATALSQSGVCHRQVIEHGWCDDLQRYRRRGLELVERALSLAGGDARVLAQSAVSLAGLEDSLDRAIPLIERAIVLNPASPFVWLVSGVLRLRSGEPELAAENLETAMRLDPISEVNGFYRMYLAAARFQQGRFDDALALFRTTSSRLPVSYAVLAAIHGHRGEASLGQAALKQFDDLDAGPIEPIADIWFPHPEHRQLLLEGIALAQSAPASPAAAPV